MRRLVRLYLKNLRIKEKQGNHEKHQFQFFVNVSMSMLSRSLIVSGSLEEL